LAVWLANPKTPIPSEKSWIAPKWSGDAIWSQLVQGASDPDSQLMSVGKSMLSSLFGDSQSSVASALSAVSGMRYGALSTLMTMVAAMVMSFLGKRARNEGMTIIGLASLLQSEIPVIRNTLPAGVNDLIWPTAKPAALPVIAQVVESEKSSTRWWLVPLILLAVIPCLWWPFSHMRWPVPVKATHVQVIPSPNGTANRVAPSLGSIVKVKLPKKRRSVVRYRIVQTQARVTRAVQ
jgi:hypothetical protein